MSEETLQIVPDFRRRTFPFETNLCFLPKLLCQTEFECNRWRSDLVTFDFSSTLKCAVFSSSSLRGHRVVARQFDSLQTKSASRLISDFYKQRTLYFPLRFRDVALTQERNQEMEMNNSTPMSTFARSLIQQCQDFMNLLIVKAIIIRSLRC